MQVGRTLWDRDEFHRGRLLYSYVGLGVPLGTDKFIQKFVYDTCRTAVTAFDVDKLDHIMMVSSITDSFALVRQPVSNT
jgi:hypothetical protein